MVWDSSFLSVLRFEKGDCLCTTSLTLSCASLFLSVVAELQTLCNQYWNRIYNLEGDKWDLERISKLKECEVNKRVFVFVPWPPVALTFILWRNVFHVLDQLKRYVKEYFERVNLCESQKWDLEYEVRKRDWEVWRNKRGGPICKAPPRPAFFFYGFPLHFLCAGGRKIAIRPRSFSQLQFVSNLRKCVNAWPALASRLHTSGVHTGAEYEVLHLEINIYN